MYRPRCVVENGVLEPCEALDLAFEESRNGKGVVPIEIFRRSTGEFIRSGAVMRSGHFARRGILLNYCPFCGAAIGAHMATADVKGKRVGNGNGA